MINKVKPVGGEMGGIAFIYWNEIEKRFELKIDNKLKAHSSGENKLEHLEGKENLGKIAEEKGYTVIYAE